MGILGRAWSNWTEMTAIARLIPYAPRLLPQARWSCARLVAGQVSFDSAGWARERSSPW
jgi:hypothetical protein